jgi:hypothetical protein
MTTLLAPLAVRTGGERDFNRWSQLMLNGRRKSMICRRNPFLLVLLCAAVISGCGEPNPGPVGKTVGGGAAVQSPFGPPPPPKTPPKAKGKAVKEIDTSKWPPK